MLNDNLIFIFLVPTPFFIYQYVKAFIKFRELYQEKKQPDFPFTPVALQKELGKNPARIIARIPVLPLLWWKTLFERIDDAQLISARDKVIRWMLYFCLYFVLIAIIMVALTISHKTS